MWDFELVRLERTPSPDNGAKGDWYHYVIANRITEVSGQRCGSEDEVSRFVKSCIQRLNTRHLGAAGRM